MIIGKYRITKKGKLVFGMLGVLLVVLIGMVLSNVLKDSKSNITDAKSMEQPQTVVNTSENTTSVGTQTNSTVANTTPSESTIAFEEKNKILSTAKAIVFFKPNDYELDASYYSELDLIVNMSKRFKEAQILVDGHYNGIPGLVKTDTFMTLALNRAEMVEAYLVSQGVSQDRIIVTNLGCNVPINKDDSWQEIEKNRRVEVHFKPLNK
jgi:outer membrane protein OmpA-like peptidoglycan-associated protein